MTSHGTLLRSGRAWTVVLLVALLAGACGRSSTQSPVVPSAGSSEAPSPVCPTPGAGPVLPWWTNRVFYEVFVRSFQDSDGDGIGDLRGLTARLDDLNDGDPATTEDLGVTGLWLMPIAESPSYHGYDIVDYRAIESDYGTADDFRALLAAANERGIAVIVDLVINHTSRDHPWFQDAQTPGSPHDAWYVWSADHPGYARSDGSRVWHTAGDRYYYGYFWEGMPDLNLTNPDVTAELDDVGRFWLDEMGVDGFRLDAARHLVEDGRNLENTPATVEWLAGFRERLKADHPHALVLGEVWDATSMSARYVRDSALDVTFDFGLASATIGSIRSGDAGSLHAAQAEAAEAYPLGGLATFLTNHDQNRIMNELGGQVPSARVAAALLLTGGGVPFVYYGEEIGLTGRKPDERIRTPMRWDATKPAAGFTTGTPWQPLGDDPPGTDVATQAADPASLLSLYRDLIRLRAAHPALATGEWTPVDAEAPSVVAYLRHVPDEVVLVVANLADEPVTSPVLGLEAGPLCGVTAARVLFGEGEATAPTVNAAGGFEGYAPVARMGPREAFAIELGSP
jgi:alpha-amylase